MVDAFAANLFWAIPLQKPFMEVRTS